jgi:diguanylate cyclase (GGDEF)-like protein
MPIAVATAPWHAALMLFAAGTVMLEVRLQTVLGALFSARALRAETVLGRVIDDSFAGILVIEADGRIRTASRVASAVLGDSMVLAGARANEVLPKALADAVDEVFLHATTGGDGRCTGEAVIHDRHRRRRVLEYVATLSWVGDGSKRSGHGPDDRPVVCLTFSDVTDRRAAELRIAHLARFDTLTDLANRNQLLERVDRELGGIAAGAPPFALVRFDLDGFRKVNDALGHELGDEVIREIGRRAGDLLPDGALLARLWADDFAVVVPGPDAAAEARVLAEAILDVAGEEMALNGHHVTLGASVGLVEVVSTGTADYVLACGDVALGRAKDRGGKAIVVFEPEMLLAVAARQKLERDLWRALHGEQFEVLYQPQVTMSDGRLIGTEALLRWQHPTRGNVSPAEFVPVAEAVGLIEPLGRWVLERACRDALSWPAHVKVAVNVSSTQFVRCDVVAMVREALASTGLPASRLEIEITESLFMDLSYGIGETLARIHDMGVGIALDDFGTGFSSLGYIHRFPIDKIKIDRSFVTGLPRDRDSAAIVTAVATLAGSLGMRVIAEGIELDVQADWLKDIGVTEGQGYLYGRAKSASAIAAQAAEQAAVGTVAADRVA